LEDRRPGQVGGELAQQQQVSDGAPLMLRDGQVKSCDMGEIRKIFEEAGLRCRAI